LLRKCAICPQAVVEYVVFSKADDAACSSGGFVVSLSGIGVLLGQHK
jgi:hypothetical protein